MKIDKELKAMQQVVNILEPLTVDARRRVIDWAIDKTMTAPNPMQEVYGPDTSALEEPMGESHG